MLPDSLLDLFSVVKQQSGKLPHEGKNVITGCVCVWGGILYNQKANFFISCFDYYLWNQTQFLKKLFQVIRKSDMFFHFKVLLIILTIYSSFRSVSRSLYLFHCSKHRYRKPPRWSSQLYVELTLFNIHPGKPFLLHIPSFRSVENRVVQHIPAK